MTNFDAINAELRASARWVLWRLEDDTNRKRCKILKQVRRPASNASSTNASTWATFQEACAHLGELPPSDTYKTEANATGVGLVIDVPFIGVDLDDCVLDNGQLNLVASEFLTRFPPTYTEYSPSGKGLHLWYKGTHEKDGLRTATAEVYCRGRYFTMTGDRLPDTPDTLCQLDKAQVSAVYAWVNDQRPQPTKPKATSTPTDHAKLDLLMKGEYEAAGFTDISAAVQSLLTYLAYTHLLDRDKVETAFKASGLYKDHPGKSNWVEKWDRLRVTELDKACEQARSWVERDRTRQPNIKKTYTAAVKVVNFLTVEVDVLEWLWPEKVPLANVTIFAGPPGIGKSLMALDLAGRGSTGQPFLDGLPPVPPFKSLLLMSEDDRATIIKPRLQAMNADMSMIDAVDMVTLTDTETNEVASERFICLETDLTAVRAQLLTDPRVRLVVIDPISNYMGTKSMNSDQEFRSILMPIVQLAQETNVAVIVVMHNSKQVGRDALAKVGGSLGGVGVARVGWTFMKTEVEGEYDMLLMKGNLGRFPGIKYTTESVNLKIKGRVTSQARMKFLATSKVNADTKLAEDERPDAKRESVAVALLKRLIPVGGQCAGKLMYEEAEQVGISASTLKRAIHELELTFSGSKRAGLFYSWPETSSKVQSDGKSQDELPF